MTERIELPAQAYLLARFSYNPRTGVLRWKPIPEVVFRYDKAWNARFAGKPAGTIKGGGYCVVGIHHVVYLAHRLIWRMVTGDSPTEIDHINGDCADNRWSNLRLATHAENGRNRKIHRNNRSGIKGAWWNKRMGKWQSAVRLLGEKHHLGSFDTKKEAAEAYRQASAKLHGKFANYG